MYTSKLEKRKRISQKMQPFKLFSVHLLFIFAAVSRLLCGITKCQEPFGGKVFLLDGDTASDFTKIKVLDSRKLFKKNGRFVNER